MLEYALPFLSLHKMATEPITVFETRLHKQYRCNPGYPIGSRLVLAVADVFASRLLRFILCALPSSLSGSDLFLYDPDLLQPNRCLPQPRDLGLSYAYSSFALCAALFTLIV